MLVDLAVFHWGGPIITRIYNTAQTVVAIGSTNHNCAKCKDPTTPQSDKQKFCEGCFDNIYGGGIGVVTIATHADIAPLVSDIVSCNIRSFDTTYDCKFCTLTTKCSRRWGGLLPDEIITMHCTDTCEWKDASKYPESREIYPSPTVQEHFRKWGFDW